MVYSNMSAASSITASIEKGSENAANFTSLVAPKKESKQKFKSFDINSIYQGKSEVATKSVAAPKHGFQTVGKVNALTKRVPPVVSTLKHSNSSSASLNAIQNNGSNSTNAQSTTGQSSQVGWVKLGSTNNSRTDSSEFGDTDNDAVGVDLPNITDKDYPDSGPSSFNDPIQDDTTSGCKLRSSNQLDSPVLREKEAKESSLKENERSQQSPLQAGQSCSVDSKTMEICQSDGNNQSSKTKNFLIDPIKELSSRTKSSQPVYKNDSNSSYVSEKQFSHLISDKELKSLEKLEAEACSWMADEKIDYAQKIDFSDSSDEENQDSSSNREPRKKVFDKNPTESGKSVINRENSRRSSDSNPKQLASNGQYSKPPANVPFDNVNSNSDQGRAYYGRKSDSVYEFREHDERRRHEQHYDRSSRSQQLPRGGRQAAGDDYNTYQPQPIDRNRTGGYRDRTDYDDSWSSRKRMSDDVGRRPLIRSNMDNDDNTGKSRKSDMVEHKSMAPPPSIDIERDRYDRRRDRMTNDEDFRGGSGNVGGVGGGGGPPVRSGNDRYLPKNDRYATNLPPRLQRLEQQKAQEQRRYESERFERENERFREVDPAFSRAQDLSRSGSDRNVPNRDVPDRGSWRNSDKNRRIEEPSNRPLQQPESQIKKLQENERKDVPPVVEVMRKLSILEQPDKNVKTNEAPVPTQASQPPPQPSTIAAATTTESNTNKIQPKQTERIEVLKRPQEEAVPVPAVSTSNHVSAQVQPNINRYSSQHESRRNDRRNDGHHHQTTHRHSSGKQPLLSEPEIEKKHDIQRRPNAQMSANVTPIVPVVDDNKNSTVTASSTTATAASTIAPSSSQSSQNLSSQKSLTEKSNQSQQDDSTIKGNRKNDNRNISNQSQAKQSAPVSNDNRNKTQRDRKNSYGSRSQHFDNHEDWEVDRGYNHSRHKESQRNNERSDYNKKSQQQDQSRVPPNERYGSDRNHPKRKEQYSRDQQHHNRRDEYEYRDDGRNYRNSGNQQRDQHRQHRDDRSITGAQSSRQNQSETHSKQATDLSKNMSQLSLDDNKNSRKQQSQQQHNRDHHSQSQQQQSHHQQQSGRKHEQDHYEEDSRAHHPRTRTTSNASSNKTQTVKNHGKKEYNTQTSGNSAKSRNDRLDNKKTSSSGDPQNQNRNISEKKQSQTNQSQQINSQDSSHNKNVHHSKEKKVPFQSRAQSHTPETAATNTAAAATTTTTTTTTNVNNQTRKDSKTQKINDLPDSGIEISDHHHSISSASTSQRSSPNDDEKSKDSKKVISQPSSNKKIEPTKTEKVLHNNLPEGASLSRQLNENLTSSSVVEPSKFKLENESLKVNSVSAPEPAPISQSSGTEELKAKFESVKKVWEKDSPKDDKAKLSSASLISKSIPSSVVTSKTIMPTKVDTVSPPIIPLNPNTGFIAPVQSGAFSHALISGVGPITGAGNANNNSAGSGIVSFPSALSQTPTSSPVLPQIYSNNSMPGNGAPVTPSPYPFGAIDPLNAFNQNVHAQNAAAASMQSMLPFLPPQQNPGGASTFNPMAAMNPAIAMIANQTNQFSANQANLLMAQQFDQMNKFGLVNPNPIMKNNAFSNQTQATLGPISGWQTNQSVNQNQYINMNSTPQPQQIAAPFTGQMNRNQTNMNAALNQRNSNIENGQNQYFRRPNIVSNEQIQNHMAPNSTYLNHHDPTRQSVNPVAQMGNPAVAMHVRQNIPQNNQFSGQNQMNQNWTNQFSSQILLKQMTQNGQAPFMQMFGTNGGTVPQQIMCPPMSNIPGGMNVNRTSPPASAMQIQAYGPIGRHNSGSCSLKNASVAPFSGNSNTIGSNSQQQNSYSGNAGNSGRKSFNSNNGRGRNSFYNNRNSTTPSPSGGIKNSMVDNVHSNNVTNDSCAPVVNSKD